MKKIVFTAILFFALHISQPVYGGTPGPAYSSNDYLQYIRSDYIAINNKEPGGEPDPVKKPEPESPLRRFEITFFISAPFVFIATFATLHVFDVIKKQDPNVSVWKDYKAPLLIGTFGISSAIAFREAWIAMGTNDKQKTQGTNEQTLYFYAKKNF